MEDGGIGAVADGEVLGSRHERAAAVQRAGVECHDTIQTVEQRKPANCYSSAGEGQTVGATSLAYVEGGIAGRIGYDQATAPCNENRIAAAAAGRSDHHRSGIFEIATGH